MLSRRPVVVSAVSYFLLALPTAYLDFTIPYVNL